MGGSALMPARSAPIRWLGRSPSERTSRVFAFGSHALSWVLKSAGSVKARPGQERGLQIPVGPLHHTLGLRVPRGGLIDPGPQRTGERAGAHRQPVMLTDPSLVVPHQHLRTAPSDTDSSCHIPASRSPVVRLGNNNAMINRE